MPERTAGFHGGTECFRGVVRHANTDEHDRETFARLAPKARAPRDRGRQAIVWQAGRRE